MTSQDPHYLRAAIDQARRSLETGKQLSGTPGLPIGAALASGDELRAVGHNQRVQRDDPILHADYYRLQAFFANSKANDHVAMWLR